MMMLVASSSSLVAGEKRAGGYRDLEVFQRSLDALVGIHTFAATLPNIERYELASQLRRASKSIPANIAEGYAKRRSVKEFISYLTTALGSANEVEVHLEIAGRLTYGDSETRTELLSEYGIIGRQLAALIRSWQPSRKPGTRDQ